MAVRNGSWSSTTGTGNRGRLRWEITQSPSRVVAGTSSVSLRLRVWYQSRYSVIDSSNSYSITGSWSGSGSRSINHGGSGGQTLLYDGTITVSTSYANTVSRNFRASFSGINATPGIPSISGSHTVSRRPVSVPAAPSNASATRQSDSRINVSWTRNASTGRPYSNQLVQRRIYGIDGSWGSWKTIATVSSTATSYADRSVRDNRTYEYRLRARNAAGTSGTSAVTTAVRTTPRPPADVVAKKLSGGDIRVEFRRVAPYSSAVEHQLQDNPDGAGWVTVATQSGSGNFTVSDPDPSVTHRYRVRTVSTYGGVTLRSGWSSASNVVQLLARPSAPTRLGPSGTLDRDEPVTFAWRHNSVDTTEQTEAQLQYREQGTPTWVNAGLNLIENPSFETDTDRWSARGGAAVNITRTTSFPELWEYLGGRDGDWVVQFSPTSTPSEYRLVSERIPVTPGQWVVWSGLMASDPGVQSTIASRFFSSSDALLGSHPPDEGWATAESPDGLRFTGAVQAPATATQVEVVLWSRGPGGGDVPAGVRSWADAIALVSASSEAVARDLVAAAGGVGGESVRVPAFGVSGRFEWRVRTRGEFPEWSPYSSVGSFRLAAAPSVAINAPDGSDLAESRATLEIGYDNADDSPQSRVQAELVHDGVVLETLSWSGTADSGTFRTDLDNETEYTIRARVRAGNGLWSEYDTVSFTTDFPSPVAFEVDAEWDRDSGAVILAGIPAQETLAQYAWTGAPNASTSTRTTVDGTVTNQFTNPDMVAGSGSVPVFEGLVSPVWRGDPDLVEVENTDGTFSYFGTPVEGVSAVGGVVVQSEQWSKSGGVSARFITTAEQSGDNYPITLVYAIGLPVGSVGVWRRQDAIIGEYDFSAVPGATNLSILLGTESGEESDPAPNAPGETLMSIIPDDVYPNGITVILPGGGNVGDSVWFDILTITDVLHEGPPFSGESESVVEAETLAFQRRDDEGSPWVTLAEDIEPGTEIVDPTPALALPEYRIVSHTSLPSSATGPVLVVPWVHGRDPIFVNSGSDYGLVCKAIGNQAGDEPAIEQDSVVFAGVDFPVAIFGDTETHGVSFTGTIHKYLIEHDGVSTRAEWLELLRQRQVVCYRDCQGRKLYGLLNLSFSQSGPVETINISVDRVWHEEGVTT